MIDIIPSERGLFAISDPGASKGVLAYIMELKEKGCTDYRIISDREHSFYGDFGLDVELVSEEDIQACVSGYKPDYVFTGTSYSSSFELNCLKAAEALSTCTYSFVDHRTSFTDRFLINGDIYKKVDGFYNFESFPE